MVDYKSTNLILFTTQERWLLSQGPQCSALTEVVCWESTCTVAEGTYMYLTSYMLFLHICRTTVRVEKKLAFFTICHFWPIIAVFLQILPQFFKNLQKSKCVHHLCTRRHLCAKFDDLRPPQSPTPTPAHQDTQLILPSVNLSGTIIFCCCC